MRMDVSGVAAAVLLSSAGCGFLPPKPRDQAAVTCAPAPGAAQTSTPTLIRLAGGSTVSLGNDITEGDAYVCHRDLGPVRQLGYHLVKRIYYEGRDYLLISSSTGHMTVLPDTPVISPGGRRVLVASMDYEAGYEPNLLQVWRVTPDSLVREWELETGEYPPAHGWGASEPVWTSDTAVVLTKNVPEDGHATTFRRSRVHLIRQTDGTWVGRPSP